jgi:hypothetical protein
MNIKQYINDLHLTVGESRRMNCPNCNSYNTFTVTNNMGSVLWNCYKLSCSLSGSSRVTMSVDDIRTAMDRQIANQKDETFSFPEHIVPHGNRKAVTMWCDEWKLSADQLNLYYDVKENRVVFPVTSNGKIVDGVGRALGRVKPKWKRYGKNTLPYSHGCGRTAVVVEDCVSAAVVASTKIVGVAVLGTSLGESHKQYLSQFSTAIIALDPDALKKSLQFTRELRTYVKDVKVLKLTDDLKYGHSVDMINLISLTPKE